MSDTLYDVVIVDDADDVRAVVKQQLTVSGRFRVVGEGSTGRHAVELAAQHRPALLVMDASMPELDGLAAIPGVHAASADTTIVMFSGFDASSLRGEAIARGASEYIEKSTPIRELPSRLLAILGDNADSEPSDADAAFDQQASNVLAQHLERFRTVFDQAAIGMATLTLSGTIVRANEALVNLLGEPEARIVGQALDVFIEQSSHSELLAAFRAAVAEPHAQEVEHRLTGRSRDRWAHTTLATVRDTENRPLYLFAQLEDVTARHEAVEQLRASEERFRLMVESVQDYAIFMLDREGHVSTWNLGAQRLKGYEADEIIGLHFRRFYPVELQERKHPEFELEVARAEGRYEEEGWRVRKDGTEFWANVVITALFDRDGKHLGFAKVTRDMTERRAAETRLAASNRELRTVADRTEEFLAIIAHELQSPVATITGAADILLDYWDRLEEVERVDTLRRIGAGGERIRRLLDDLLTASRLDAGTFTVAPVPVSLRDVLDRTVHELEDQAVHVEAAGVGELTVLADPVRLVQILTNLLTNAQKYGVPPFRIDARANNGMVELRVRDSGRGPEPELQQQLFEKFAKTSTSKVRGTGLGLYIVRELARRHGGDAWYEPGPAFVVSLPAG